MKNKNKLVGLSGLAGSGKDTAADYLWERYAFAKLAFADPLRAAASDMFGVQLEVFHDRTKKDKVIDYWGMTPRQMLQLLGNDAVKPVFGHDIWARRWLLSYNFLKDTDHPEQRGRRNPVTEHLNHHTVQSRHPFQRDAGASGIDDSRAGGEDAEQAIAQMIHR